MVNIPSISKAQQVQVLGNSQTFFKTSLIHIVALISILERELKNKGYNFF